MTIHEQTSITSALKDIYGLQESNNGPHKEATSKRVQRDDEDIKKMIACFSSGLMADPFSNDADLLLNIATGVVLPSDVAVNLLSSTNAGWKQMTIFIEKRIGTNETSFWEPIPRLKVRTFNSTNKNICMRSKEKLVTVNADRDLFGRLLIVSYVRHTNFLQFPSPWLIRMAI